VATTGLEPENIRDHIFRWSHFPAPPLNRFARMEKGMDDERFATPVYVADGSRMIREIACLGDAIDFLEGLRTAPVNGTVHETALKACYCAAAGLLSIENARRAFESFAKMSRILEDVSPQPATVRQKIDADGDMSI
jgi:hypothetical protein